MSLRDLFHRSDSAAPTTAPRNNEPASDQPLPLAQGATISVSEEQHYQTALALIRGTEPFRQVVASIEINAQGNPWARKPTGPIAEVKVDRHTVGFLTPAMTRRFRRLIDTATAQGRTLTATAGVGIGTGASGRDIEIGLDAIPLLVGQRTIVGLDVQTHPEYVVTRDGRAHAFKSEVAAGWLVECGMPVVATAGELILRTKPWVGRVRVDGSLIEGWPLWCERCRPDRGSVEDGGRFGDYTSISTTNRFSSGLTVEAVTAALATRFDFDVAGESFRPGYPDTLLRFAEVLRVSRPGERLAVVLRRDPGNPHDVNAIEVHVPSDAGHVGFVPGELARMLAPMLDRGDRIRSWAVEVRVRDSAPDRPGLTVTLQKADIPQ